MQEKHQQQVLLLKDAHDRAVQDMLSKNEENMAEVVASYESKLASMEAANKRKVHSGTSD